MEEVILYPYSFHTVSFRLGHSFDRTATGVFRRPNVAGTVSMDLFKTLTLTVYTQVNLALKPDSPLLLHDRPGTRHRLIAPGNYIRETDLLRKRVLTDSLEQKTLHQILVRTYHTVMWVCTRPAKHKPCPWTSNFWTIFKTMGFPNKAVRPLVIESSWHIHQARLPPYVKLQSDPYIDELFWIESQ